MDFSLICFGLLLTGMALGLATLGPEGPSVGHINYSGLALGLMVISLGSISVLAGIWLWNLKRIGGLIAFIYSAIFLSYGAALVFAIQTIPLVQGISIFGPVIAAFCLVVLDWKNLN